MISKELPGTKLPYFLRAGDGEKYLFGGQLATMIAREQETAGLLEAVILSGGKGSRLPRIGTRSRRNRSSFSMVSWSFGSTGRARFCREATMRAFRAGR